MHKFVCIVLFLNKYYKLFLVLLFLRLLLFHFHLYILVEGVSVIHSKGLTHRFLFSFFFFPFNIATLLSFIFSLSFSLPLSSSFSFTFIFPFFSFYSDLKLNNIFVHIPYPDELPILKIGDFGTACKFDAQNDLVEPNLRSPLYTVCIFFLFFSFLFILFIFLIYISIIVFG